MVPYALARTDIAGAVVAVVKGNDVLFEKGYGYADVVARRPMSVRTTLIRPGSITKLFTFTAVMQLVEEHKLDLDQDINTYLDFRIPPAFGRPITLRNLLTHTAGFEDSIKDVFVANTSELRSLRDYVRSNLPRRVEPPGAVVAYSNYGAALAGYIVERVSREPYADYIRDHILVPLHMSRTTLQQPLPSGFSRDMAKGYLIASARKAGDFELIGAAPAGAMTTTVDDLTHFAIAHLQDGAFAGGRILQPETARLMHATAYRAAPGLNGYALGFYEESRNGLRIIGHGGDTALFHSDLHLILEPKVAVILAFNSDGAGGGSDQARTFMFRAFLDRYFPFHPIQGRTFPGAPRDAARVVGPYEISRSDHSSFMELAGLLQTETVSAEPDGDIEFSFFKDASGTPRLWREIGPLLYQEENGQALLRFMTDSTGRIRYFISDDFIPVFVYEPAPWVLHSSIVVPLLVAIMTTFAITVLTWPILSFVRLRRRRKLDLPRIRQALRLLSRLAAIAALGVMVGWAMLLASATSEVGALSDSLDPSLTVLYFAGCVAFTLCLAAIGNAATAWTSGERNLLTGVGESLVGASAAVFCWFLLAFHLISFNYHY